jgi:hypothetical protein
LVEVLYGTPAIVSIFEKIAQLPKNSRLLALQPDNSVRPALEKNSIADLLRINSGIKEKALIVEGVVHEKSVGTILDVLGKEKGQRLFDSFIGRLEDYTKIPDEFANVESEIYVFANTAYIIDWNKEIAIGIHDKEMVALLYAMFSCVKETGSRYSQNTKMKSYKDAINGKTYSPKYASTTSLRASTSEGEPSASSSPESRT